MNTILNPFFEHIALLKERSAVYAALPDNRGLLASQINERILHYFMDLSIIIDLELDFSEKDKQETGEALVILHQQMISEMNRLVEFGLIHKDWIVLHLQHSANGMVKL